MQFHNTTTAAEQAAKIASLPAIKKVWPLTLYGFEKSEVKVVGSSLAAPSVSARGASEADTFEPHVMTQIDKLHAKGIKGERKTKVAVIDTGVSAGSPAARLPPLTSLDRLHTPRARRMLW